MTDQRILRAFHTLDAPAHPSAAFADRLFDDLATELGFRHAWRPAGIAARAGRALGLDRIAAPPTRRPLAYVVAALLLLLLLAATALLVGAWLQARPSPEELVRRSQAAYANPPAVRFTIRDTSGLTDLASDGHGTWRSVGPSDAQGSYWLYDGQRVGRYDGAAGTWTTWPVTQGGPPYPFNHAVAWTRVTSVASPDVVATVSAIPCPTPTDLGEDRVAARLADHVGCPTTRTEYWLDRETHLVLRFLAGRDAPAWLGASGEDSMVEVVSFELIDSPTSTDFAWAMPDVDAGRIGPVEGTNLVVGQRATPWSGQTLDGRAISLSSHDSPVAILFFAPWCEARNPAYEAFASAADAHPGVTSLIVGVDELGTVAGYATQHPVRLPTIADPDLAIAGTWHIQTLPAIVLLDRFGAVVDVLTGAITSAEAARVLAALEAGTPIPPVASPSPAFEPSPGPPSPSPARTEVPCDEGDVTCLPIGATVPAWSGPLLAGGTLASVDLLGRPVVVWTGAYLGACGGWCPDSVYDELRQFAALAGEHQGAATFVLVLAGEKQPGGTQRHLDEAGVTLTVVYDWDGAISRDLALNQSGILGLDGQGRIAFQVVQQWEGQLNTDAVSTALGRLLSGQSPASQAP